jgi:hypothetical protein
VKLFKSMATCLACLAPLAVAPVQAQTRANTELPVSSPVAPTATPAAAQPASASRPHPVTLAAAEQGVLSCSGRINQVVSALGVNDKSGLALMLPSAQQDQRLVPLALEMPTTQGSTAYISATFAPNQANGCGASYDAVVYWPKNCSDLSQQSYAAFKLMGRLKQDILMLDGGANIKVFLLPAGAAGCISIRREVLL